MGDRTLVVNCTVPDTYDSAILVCKPDSEPTGPDDGMSKVITKGTTNTEFDVSEYIGNTYTYKLYGGIGSEIHDNDDATTFYDDYGDEITAEPFDVVTIETEDYDVYDFFICTTDMKWISIGHTVEYEPYTCYEPPSYGELIANELNGDIIQENVCNGSVLSTLTINGVNIPISYGDTIFLAETTFSSSSLLTYIYPGVWFNKTLLNDFKCGSTEFEITSTLDAIRYRYIGELDSDLNDGDTTNPVMINGVSVTAKPYDYCNYSSSSHTFMFTEKSKWVLRDDSNYNIIADGSTATINKEIKEGVSYKTLKINGVKTKVNYWDYIINVNNVYNNNYIFLPPGVWVSEYKIVNGYTNFYIDYGETIAVADNAMIGLIEQEIDVNRFYFKIFTDHNESNLINYDFDRDEWNGSEITIMYTNNNENKLTVEYSSFDYYLFRLYSGETEIYSFESPLVDDIYDSNLVNIAFIENPAKEIARPSFIYKDENSNYSYNLESPSEYIMKNIYLWLGRWEVLTKIMVDYNRDSSSSGIYLYNYEFNIPNWMQMAIVQNIISTNLTKQFDLLRDDYSDIENFYDETIFPNQSGLIMKYNGTNWVNYYGAYNARIRRDDRSNLNTSYFIFDRRYAGTVRVNVNLKVNGSWTTEYELNIVDGAGDNIKAIHFVFFVKDKSNSKVYLCLASYYENCPTSYHEGKELIRITPIAHLTKDSYPFEMDPNYDNYPTEFGNDFKNSVRLGLMEV